MLKRTPLYAAHQRLGARLIEFGGWEMPVQYTSIVEEHLAVRQAAGLFDISHMGELLVVGPGAAAYLNYVLTNDLGKLTVGQGQYTLVCLPSGGVVDDLYAYRLSEDEYLLIVNAGRIAADWDWLQTQVETAPTRDGFHLKNASAEYGALAVQGPRVAEFMDQAITGGSIAGTIAPRATELRKNQLAAFVLGGVPLYLARTGYTGEDGFELVVPVREVERVWERLLAAGADYGLRPVGLGARDTLRTEVCYPLYGHELDEQTTPLEAGLGAFVALDKGPFVGRAALVRQREQGVPKKCVAFKLTEKAPPPRPQYSIFSPGPNSVRLGQVVSGTQSPSLGVGIGLGYVPLEYAAPGTALELEIRGRRAPVVVQRKPLYRRPG
ncbi:MAG: glycine cleavage system aminomethyltransferase GcvT [Verrucomicrobia bacterium]|nr:glycine cleavage system aminomethyltransferase GcvT [Verrucomicrobiota bacterium]